MTLTRRNFLKILGTSAALVAAAPVVEGAAYFSVPETSPEDDLIQRVAVAMQDQVFPHVSYYMREQSDPAATVDGIAKIKISITSVAVDSPADLVAVYRTDPDFQRWSDPKLAELMPRKYPVLQAAHDRQEVAYG